MSGIDPNDLSPRDREHYDRLCEEKGYDSGGSGDEPWHWRNLELDLNGPPKGEPIEHSDRTVAAHAKVDPALLAEYRAVLAKIETAVVAAGAGPAELQSSECSHDHVIVGQKTAEIRCRVCGGSVDVWWWVRRITREWGQISVGLQHKREERAKLAAEVEELKRQVVNLSAQVKRRGGDPKAIRRRTR